MSMLLMILGIGAVVFVLSLLCLKTALNSSETRPELQPEKRLVIDSRFFAGDVAGVPSTVIPREVLLAQIERHVRLEQAVAENYLEFPTREALHTPSSSQFVN